jgi:hypothetical protein
MAAGRTGARVSVNATMAPDRKTSIRKHLRGIYQKAEYLQTWRIYFASYCCRPRDIVLLAFRSEPALRCGSAACIQHAVNKNLAEQEVVRQFCAGLRRKRLGWRTSTGAALVVLYTCCVVVSRAVVVCNTQEGATAFVSKVRVGRVANWKVVANWIVFISLNWYFTFRNIVFSCQADGVHVSVYMVVVGTVF